MVGVLDLQAEGRGFKPYSERENFQTISISRKHAYNINIGNAYRRAQYNWIILKPKIVQKIKV